MEKRPVSSLQGISTRDESETRKRSRGSLGERDVGAGQGVGREDEARRGGVADLSAGVGGGADLAAGVGGGADLTQGMGGAADLSAGVVGAADLSAGVGGGADLSAGGLSRLLDLPADLVNGVLKEAMRVSSAFKKVVLVCRSWAESAPGLCSHQCIPAHARIPGHVLAEGMASLGGLVSLRLPNKSVRGLLPTTHTATEVGGEASRTPSAAAAAAEEETPRHQAAPWTATLESLAVENVEFVPADISYAFPNLTRLSLAFSEPEKEDELPNWVEKSLPPRLQHLRLRLWGTRYYYDEPNSEYRRFPPSLVSLHLMNLGKRFFTSQLGDLEQLRSLTMHRCYVTSLPESIGNLRQLKNLTIRDCDELSTLPASISELVALSSLRLPWNVFQRFPDLGPHLHKSLRVFQHSVFSSWGSGLEGLPQDLAGCCNIRTLHLQNEHINSIPDLGGLGSLRDLLLDCPGVTGLPDVFSNASSLKKVKVVFKGLPSIPPSLTASTSLEVLDISCGDPLVLPPITCPPNLQELLFEGTIWEGYPTAHPIHPHHPLHVTLNPSVKKVDLYTCCVRVQGAGTSLEELALHSHHAVEGTHGDIWEGMVPPLPSLSKLTLWCDGHDQHWYRSWISRLAPLPNLRVLQIKPAYHTLFLEAKVSSSLTGQLSLDALKLEGSGASIPLPSLLTCLSASGGGSGIHDRPSTVEALKRLKDLVLTDLCLKEAPDFLEELSNLVSCRVSKWRDLRELKLPVTWTSLESLHISRCRELSLVGTFGSLQLTHPKVTDSKSEAIPGEVSFLPSLLKLELKDCPKLKVIHGVCDGNLQEIHIKGCPLLKAWEAQAAFMRSQFARPSISFKKA